jgi:NitT/TauT family transport system permease protein
MRRSLHWLAPLLAVLIVLVVWEWSVVAFHIRPFVLPRPSAVAVALVAQAPTLLPATLATAQAILFGFGLSVVVGVPLAAVLLASPWIERSLFPLIVATQLVPKVALAPLLAVWLGLGLVTKVVVAFLLSFFPMLIDTMIGLKSVDPGKILVARSMGASALSLFFRIRLPAALPQIFAGMKVASTLAVVGTIVGEFIGAREGLGNVLLAANGNFDMVLMFAAVIYLTAVGLLLFVAIEVLERLSIPWHVSQREAGNRHARH